MSQISETKPNLDDAVRKAATAKAQDLSRVKSFKFKKKVKSDLTEPIQVFAKPTKRKIRDPDSDVPYPITAVMRAMNSCGESAEKLVVVTITDDDRIGHFVLSEIALISGQYSELAKMVNRPGFHGGPLG